ncbi:hypothetical protein KSP39_PZI011122 [Platanthera zijinensis]|uniref:Reverse transcriptase domain-containing protein n=1 Tax=Platanthera zijinensis TaxID=2320716 RepID=A0AAP0BHH6_9ASPA
MSGLLMWNCRGAKKKAAGTYLRELVMRHNLGLIGLFETKTDNLTRRDVDRLIGRNWDFFHHPAVGTAGGIAVFWRTGVVDFMVHEDDSQWIVGSARIPRLPDWMVAFVYADTDPHVRRKIWEMLARGVALDAPTIIGGDFNCMLRPEDKKGGRPFVYSLGAREMEAALLANDLQELPYVGTHHTWCNNQPGAARVLVRLDRMFLNSVGLAHVPLASIRHLTRISLDHCPILLQLGSPNSDRRSRLFRFEDVWLSYPMCSKLVQRNWSRADLGSAAEVLKRKWSRTLRALFFWSKNKLQDLGALKSRLEAEVADLQVREGSATGISEDEYRTLISKAKELAATLGRLESWWKQRAKARWIKESDANTTYFHSMASNRRRANRIVQLTYGEEDPVEDPDQIERAFMDFFSNKWTGETPDLSGWPALPQSQKVPPAAAALLAADISDEKIWAAIRDLKPNRSPGRDGMTASFLHSFWLTIKKEVCSALQEFFRTGLMPPEWKETLVVLIPKVPNAAQPDKFRPISLCQTIYKVAAKVLIRRLHPLLPSLVSPEQGAFVPGRSISHHCFLAQEIMHKFKVSTARSGFMAIKIDMAQAYDKMAWGTLQQVLLLFGLPVRFIHWILQCVMHPRFALLINGKQTSWIEATCGFRQGCPLSPYAFILCSELLSRALQLQGHSIGISLSPAGPRISHLLYADDILLVGAASLTALGAIRSTLGNYCKWTGQCINLSKSMVLFSKATPSWKADWIARSLGFQQVTEMLYLGVKLAMRKLRAVDFSDLLIRIQSKVRAWGNRHLSLAGRATLITSALLPSAQFQLTHAEVPRSVSLSIDKIARFFLWQKDRNTRGMHYVDWHTVCLPTSHGGLGLHSLDKWRGPLRSRHAWDLLQPSASVFHSIVRHRYGDRLLRGPPRRGDSSVLRILHEGMTHLNPILHWQIVDGASISVLEQTWLLDLDFARWPTFIDYCGLEGLMVADLLDDHGGWSLDCLRQLFGPELISLILQVPVDPELLQDTPTLLSCFSGRTVTGLAYAALFPPPSQDAGWLKKLRLRPRERSFWWRLSLDAIPTRTWLAHRGMAIATNCPWGCFAPESRDHLLGECSCLQAVGTVLQRWGLTLPRVSSWTDLVDSLSDSACSSTFTLLGFAVYHCWQARNARIHLHEYATPTLIATRVLESASRSATFPSQANWGTTRPSRPSSPLWCPPPPPPAWLAQDQLRRRSSSFSPSRGGDCGS